MAERTTDIASLERRLPALLTGDGLDEAEAAALADPRLPLASLMAAAVALRDAGHADRISFSRKVFIPLTTLCRDVCHYCTFAQPPRKDADNYLDLGAVQEIARNGAAAGCNEALFTLGDQPERRYRAAAEELRRHGHETTLGYLEEAAGLVLERTGLLPHLNPGVMTADELRRLRRVSASMGIMLETAAARLSERGGPHWGSPDKEPAVRIATLEAAGEAAVPFTSGILIGIGETRPERIEALLVLRRLHETHGHVQEVIVQNFRAKPRTRMAGHPDAGTDDLCWTIAVARLILGARMNIQAPPNLSSTRLGDLVRAGINDWGGVSPVTPDHVNPEAPWPALRRLRSETAKAGKRLVERLAIYPDYLRQPDRWLEPAIAEKVLARADAEGWAKALPFPEAA